MESQPKIEFANSLRGVAAVSVLISHYLGVFWLSRQVAGDLANTVVPPEAVVPTPYLSHIAMGVPVSWGPFGVALFFLISGFVIPFGVEKKSAMGFLIGRAFRIYPLYIAGFTVTLAAVAISGLLSGRPFPYEAGHVLVHYIPGLRDILWKPPIDWIVWTLEIELKFYLVCALAAPLLRRGSLFIFVVPIVLFAAAVHWSVVPWGAIRKTLSYSAEYMVFMFAGVAFNFWFRKRVSTAIFVGLCTAILLMTALGMRAGAEPTMTIVSYGEAFVVFAISAATSNYWRRNRVLGFLADISYPLYVVHGVLGYAILAHLTSVGIPPYEALAVAVLASTAIAWVLHVTVEIPTHRIGQKVTALATHADKGRSMPLAARRGVMPED